MNLIELQNVIDNYLVDTDGRINAFICPDCIPYKITLSFAKTTEAYECEGCSVLYCDTHHRDHFYKYFRGKLNHIYCDKCRDKEIEDKSGVKPSFRDRARVEKEKIRLANPEMSDREVIEELVKRL